MGCFWCWVSERLATDGDCCHICKSTGWGGRGVGVGGLIACFAVCSLAHTHTHVTLHCRMLSCHCKQVMRGFCTFSCTCAHTHTYTSCYAAVRSLAFAYTHHATLLYVLLHLRAYVMRRCCPLLCTYTHTQTLHATLLSVLLSFHVGDDEDDEDEDGDVIR